MADSMQGVGQAGPIEQIQERSCPVPKVTEPAAVQSETRYSYRPRDVASALGLDNAAIKYVSLAVSPDGSLVVRVTAYH